MPLGISKARKGCPKKAQRKKVRNFGSIVSAHGNCTHFGNGILFYHVIFLCYSAELGYGKTRVTVDSLITDQAGKAYQAQWAQRPGRLEFFLRRWTGYFDSNAYFWCEEGTSGGVFCFVKRLVSNNCLEIPYLVVFALGIGVTSKGAETINWEEKTT